MYQGFRRLSLEFIEALICIIRTLALFIKIRIYQITKGMSYLIDIPIISLVR